MLRVFWETCRAIWGPWVDWFTASFFVSVFCSRGCQSPSERRPTERTSFEKVERSDSLMTGALEEKSASLERQDQLRAEAKVQKHLTLLSEAPKTRLKCVSERAYDTQILVCINFNLQQAGERRCLTFLNLRSAQLQQRSLQYWLRIAHNYGPCIAVTYCA